MLLYLIINTKYKFALIIHIKNNNLSPFYRNCDGYCILLDSDEMDWLPKDYFEKHYKQVSK